MNKFIFAHKWNKVLKNGMSSIKYILLALVTGLVVGLCSSIFSFGLDFASIIREQNPWLVLLLPIGGIGTIALYHIFKDPDDVETNLIISSIRAKDKLPFRVAPLMFVSTIITHLLGGSAGGEAPALQLGGSIGKEIGRIAKLDEDEKKTLILCGMSSGLSVILGTPLAAAFLSLEIISVGSFDYACMLPCILSSLTGNAIAKLFGVYGESFHLASYPIFRLRTALIVCILAVFCSLVSVLFGYTLHYTENLYRRYLKNHYIRAFAGGCLVLGITLLSGSQFFNGSGIGMIRDSIAGNTVPYAFLVKILITALTIGAGFKGGEILPSMAIGASFGCLFGSLIGFNPGFCAAIGMLCVFCGISSCPITALFIGFEFFGYGPMPFFLLAIAFSYYLSSYTGQRQSHKAMYRRYRANYLHRIHIEEEESKDTI